MTIIASLFPALPNSLIVVFRKQGEAGREFEKYEITTTTKQKTTKQTKKTKNELDPEKVLIREIDIVQLAL